MSLRHRKHPSKEPPKREETPEEKEARLAHYADLGRRAHEAAKRLREATEHLNEVLGKFEKVLHERWPYRGAAIDLTEDLCLLYWRGLWILDGDMNKTHLLHASREVRTLACKFMEDLVIQLQEEPEDDA